MMNLSRYSACTWRQTLNDLLDTSPLESRAFVFNESVTNLRELIDGVISLLVPFVSRRDLRLRASVGRTVAETIRADSARLGQIIFHLLNRTIRLGTQGEISLVVWAQDLNSGTQRVFISVVDAAENVVPAARSQLSSPITDDPEVAKRLGDANACLPLCRLLVQRMRGELSITSGLERGPRATFTALFAVEQRETSAGTVSGSTQVPLFSSATQARDTSASPSFEPFESRYLDALSEEGVDLHAFLNNWRQSVNDDLARLNALLREDGFEHFHGVLHRLSGAMGLVGARSLMEALRRASTSPLAHNAGSIGTLTARARTLVMQLEATSRAYRSTSQ
ncbi:histidine kinase [Paraburkholderia sediminicola]|uniref:sensor histidine kinase n=1 Tax=Paraburkholderia sediminicola TaxID=458836 RepID=UPI0038B86150